MFPTHQITRGMSSSRFLSEGPQADVRMWDQREDLLATVGTRLGELAGAAVALDPHTLLLMSNADTDEALLSLADAKEPVWSVAACASTRCAG